MKLRGIMKNLHVNYSKGQIKIQQMAFVLVAIMIFFGIVALFYLSIRSAGLKNDVGQLREDEAKGLVRKMSGSPEFSWGVTDCASCVDFDKIMVLKDQKSYSGFLDVPFLQIEKVYPKGEGECTRGNYPNCKTVTLMNEGEYVAHSAFVSLCRHDSTLNYNKCELGKINLGFRSVK